MVSLSRLLSHRDTQRQIFRKRGCYLMKTTLQQNLSETGGGKRTGFIRLRSIRPPCCPVIDNGDFLSHHRNYLPRTQTKEFHQDSNCTARGVNSRSVIQRFVWALCDVESHSPRQKWYRRRHFGRLKIESIGIGKMRPSPSRYSCTSRDSLRRKCRIARIGRASRIRSGSYALDFTPD